MSPERRQYPRFRTKSGTMCASVSGQIPSFRARILDISQGGARLLVTPSLKVGDLLRIRLSRVVEGRLVYTIPTPGGKWVVGCAFKGGISESEVNYLAGKSCRWQQMAAVDRSTGKNSQFLTVALLAEPESLASSPTCGKQKTSLTFQSPFGKLAPRPRTNDFENNRVTILCHLVDRLRRF